MIYYKISNKKRFRYIFIIIDKFSKSLRCIPLKNKNSQSITNELPNALSTSKRSPLELESDPGAEFYNSISQNFFKGEKIHHYSRFTDKSPCKAELVISILRNLLKKPVFSKCNADWLSELQSVFKQRNKTIQNSAKLKPVDASNTANETLVFNNLGDDRQKHIPKIKLGQLVLSG